MIEQTEMEVTNWHYHPPTNPITEASIIKSATNFDVMPKRASTKKGIACRFSCIFKIDGVFVLEYVGENSYVIDFEDVIDRTELLKMIRNAFEKFNEKFNFRKLGTVLSNTSLSPLNESNIDLDTILPMLI
jgi:hypothetical protein